MRTYDKLIETILQSRKPGDLRLPFGNAFGIDPLQESP
jgi:hypothetical protein